MKILNLTPHVMNIYNEKKEEIATIPPNGDPVRITAIREKVGEVLGIPLFKTRYSDPVGLPDYDPDTMIIVSGMVRTACQDREDLWQPGELLRNAEGKPIGSVGLSQ